MEYTAACCSTRPRCAWTCSPLGGGRIFGRFVRGLAFQLQALVAGLLLRCRGEPCLAGVPYTGRAPTPMARYRSPTTAATRTPRHYLEPVLAALQRRPRLLAQWHRRNNTLAGQPRAV